METAIKSIISMLSQHPYLSPFISGLVTEETLILTTLLSGNGTIPFGYVLLFGLLGIITSDVFWFLFAKIGPVNYMSSKISQKRKILLAKTKLKTTNPPTNFKSYLATKFIFGIRTWGIFYCSHHKQPFNKFLLHTSFAAIIWVAVVVTISRIFSEAVVFYFKFTGNFFGMILSIFIVLISWIFLSILSAKFLTKSN